MMWKKIKSLFKRPPIAFKEQKDGSAVMIIRDRETIRQIQKCCFLYGLTPQEFIMKMLKKMMW